MKYSFEAITTLNYCDTISFETHTQHNKHTPFSSGSVFSVVCFESICNGAAAAEFFTFFADVPFSLCSTLLGTTIDDIYFDHRF